MSGAFGGKLPLGVVATASLAVLAAGPGESAYAGWATDTRHAAAVDVILTEGTNMAAALSPDGETLALDLIGRIWTMPAEGGPATPITDPFGDARQPQWSPDGSRLVFQAYWSGDYDVWAVAADGSGLTQLTHGPFDDREPVFSPDGGRVFFSSDRGGSYDIWELDLSSGALRRVTTDEGNEYTPAPAADGRVAFVSDGSEAGLWVTGTGDDARRLSEAAGDDLY